MSEQSYVARYKTFSPDVRVEERTEDRSLEAREETRMDGVQRYLTWAILSVCLALWAIIGFILWVPLLLRSMLRFSFALSQSMLQGEQPVEAGRILRETVVFYRRGFTVAIDAVFGTPARRDEKTKARGRLDVPQLVREVLWATVFWYLVLFGFGVVEVSPVEGWAALMSVPWAELWSTAWSWVTGLVA